MEFFAVNGKRPIRLSEPTRKFAFDSLNYKYGRDTGKNHAVLLDDIRDFERRSDLEKYDIAIERIAKEAPIRICEGEKVTGAATLGLAIKHIVPVTYQGQEIFDSVSHLTIDFETVLKKGINSIQREAQKAFKKYEGTEKQEFINSCLSCMNSMRIWHKRYLDALGKDPTYQANYENLKKVPFGPASNFYEAVQSLWFTFAFVRLCGNWPGIGRIDWLLGEYLEKDLANGILTLDEAREILAHFFIKGCEWIQGGDYGSGDAQHYQNILLGGIDEKGVEVTNTVTYLVLDILEELGISDFPTTVRIGKNTTPTLLNRVAEVIRLGGGVVAIYNEDLIIESLVDYGYELSEARKFANDGCWEIQIPGKTFFSYIPFDSLQVLQQMTLENYSDNILFEDFGSLYSAYIRDLRSRIKELIDTRNGKIFVDTGAPSEEWGWKHSLPCTVVSLFEQGCIESGLSYWEGGPKYNVLSPHIGGLADVVNSLYAIKKLVFDDKKVSFPELMTALKNNWEHHEILRQYALNRYSYFGNDHDEVDHIAASIIKDFAQICDELESAYKTPVPYAITYQTKTVKGEEA